MAGQVIETVLTFIATHPLFEAIVCALILVGLCMLGLGIRGMK